MSTAGITIRAERHGDEAAIRRVHEAAFPKPAEGRLVDLLREADRLDISLVALVGDEIIGHIAFSPVTIGENCVGLGLAPVAVLPDQQRRGIGEQLIMESLDACRRINVGMVVVLGEPAYYRRFGFAPARQWNLQDEYDGGDAFQAIELIVGALPPGGGLVKYAPEFAIFS